jgi:transcriptional regulator with XRE-family HTH domain
VSHQLQEATLSVMGGTPEGGDWSRVAAFVRSRRLEMDLSQAAAARKAKVGMRTWFEIENAKGPKRLLTLAKMSKFLYGDECSDALEKIAAGGRPPRVSRTVTVERLDPIEAVQQARDIPDEGKGAIINTIEYWRGQRRQA